MTAEYRQLEHALTQAGFTVREGKHRVWRHERGAVVVLSRTPSDSRSYLNDRADARRAMRRVGVTVTI